MINVEHSFTTLSVASDKDPEDAIQIILGFFGK